MLKSKNKKTLTDEKLHPVDNGRLGPQTHKGEQLVDPAGQRTLILKYWCFGHRHFMPYGSGNPIWDVHSPQRSAWIQIPNVLSIPVSPSYAHFISGVPATHMGDPDWVPVFCLQPTPFLAVVDVWESLPLLLLNKNKAVSKKDKSACSMCMVKSYHGQQPQENQEPADAERW